MLAHTFLQTSHATCGRVVLNVLLAHMYRQETYLAYQSHLPLSCSFWDMVDKAKGAGVTLTPVRMYHYPTFLKQKKPFIALIHPTSPHYVLVRPKGRYVYVFDPGYGEEKHSRKNFWSMFTHYALIVNQVRGTPSISIPKPFSLRFPWYAIVFGFLTLLFGFLFWWVPPFKGQAMFLLLLSVPQGLFFLAQAWQFSFDQRRWFHGYQSYLVNAKQFERWVHLSRLATLRQLRNYLLILSSSLIVLYISSISWILLAMYGGLAFMFKTIDPRVQNYLNHRKRTLEKLETSLTYPLQASAFFSLQKQSFYVILLESFYMVSLLCTILITLTMYGWLFPYSHFSHWISGVSIFLSLLAWLRHLRVQKNEKKQFYSLLDTFLNCK